MLRCPHCFNPSNVAPSKTPKARREKLERTLVLLKQEEEQLQKKLHENLLRQHRIESSLSDHEA